MAAQNKSKLKEEVDALREDAGDLLDNLRQVFSASRDEVVRSAQVGRLRVDVYKQKKEREGLFQKLGERVHELVEGGSLSHPAIEEILEEIRAVDAQLDEIQASIEEGRPSPAAESSPKKASPAKKKASSPTKAKGSPAKKAKASPAKKTKASPATKAKASPAKKSASSTAKKPAGGSTKKPPKRSPKSSPKS